MSRRQAAAIALLLIVLWPCAGMAQSLFADHQVTVQFATADGKPLANAEVRVFAPGKPDHPAVTGRTDSAGKFVFGADRGGFWTAEARSGKEIGRVMVRVGGGNNVLQDVSPYWMLGGLLLLLTLTFAFRVLRLRLRRRQPGRPGPPPRTY